MNFGVPGVVAGFLALGFALMRLDLGIMGALGRGDMSGLLKCAMPGLTLLAPGGNIMEIMIAAVAAVLCAFGLAYTIKTFAPWAIVGRTARPMRPWPPSMQGG